MKKLFFFSIITSALLTSCDYVDNPYPEVNANLGDTTTCPALIFPAITSTPIKKILIEDFTGHTCGNCPWAAEELHTIDTLYPGQIVGLAIHVGSTFAAPSPGYMGTPSTSFLADYRTPVGDQYNSVFDPEAIGLPQGMFNRKQFDASTQTHLQFFPNWQSYASTIVSETANVSLQIATNYDPATRKICCAVKDSFLIAMNDTLKLTVLLTQDSIIDWQDYKGTAISNYVHRHMLRDAITPSGAWGEALASGSIAAATTHVNKFAYTIPASYNGIACDENQCHIIAFIYKVNTYEIIQVEEVKLIP